MVSSFGRKVGALALAAVFALTACGGGSGTVVPHQRSIHLVNQVTPGDGGGGTADCTTTNTCNPNCAGAVDACTTYSTPMAYNCDIGCYDMQGAFGGHHMPVIQMDPNNPGCYLRDYVEKCPPALVRARQRPGTLSAMAPGVGATIGVLTTANLPVTASSAAEAQAAVASIYSNPVQAFSTTAQTMKIEAWSSSYTTAFNGTTPPSFSNPSSITGNTLISFSENGPAAGTQMARNFTTTVDQLLLDDGTLANPTQIQSILDLPYTPQYATTNLVYPDGAQVYVGEVAGGAEGYGGAGGAAELFSTEAAIGGETVGITEALEALGALLLLDKNRHAMSHRRSH